MFADPERRMLRRPVVALLKERGGVDPESTLAGELRHMGITHKSAPGLFRRGGRGAADNLPRSDCSLFADSPDDGNGYVPESVILEALRDELHGTPWRTADELEAIANYRESVETFDDRFGLVYASEEMGITDETIIESARNLLICETECDPFVALERAVMATDIADAAEAAEAEIPFPPAKPRARKRAAAMKPEELKKARAKLGLSVNDMAAMLGVDPVQVRRMEMQPGKESSRPIRGTTERLIRAYLDGYRPRDWPAPE